MESPSSSGRRSRGNRERGTDGGTSSSRNGVDLVILDDDCPTEPITNPGGVLRRRPLPTVENQRAEWREDPVSPGAHQNLNASPEPDRENPLADVLGTGNQVEQREPTVQQRYDRLGEELRRKRLRMSALFDSECAPYLRRLYSIRDSCTLAKLYSRMSSDHLDAISASLRSRDQQDAGSLV